MKILIACEFSGKVRNSFRQKGHDVWSCDIEPASDNSIYHIKGDVLNVLNDNWDMLIAFPPCTYLTVTANRWLKDQPPRKSGVLVGADRRQAQKEAAEFFMKFANADIENIAIENPVGYMSSFWRKPDQVICPTMFGHKEPKKTCLWLKNLPKLDPTKIVEPEYHTTKSGKRVPAWFFLPKQSPERKKMRSITFQGIANAMANQWG